MPNFDLNCFLFETDFVCDVIISFFYHCETMYVKTKRIVFVRHGQSLFNSQGLDCTDVGLSDLGCQQSIKLGRRLKGERFDLVVLSPMKRAQDTFEHAMSESQFECKSVVINPLCRENIEEQSDCLEGEHLESIKETNNRSFRRAARFYKWLLQQPEQNILVVSHSDFIRSITCVAYSIENIYWGHYLKNTDFLIVHETD